MGKKGKDTKLSVFMYDYKVMLIINIINFIIEILKIRRLKK